MATINANRMTRAERRTAQRASAERARGTSRAARASYHEKRRAERRGPFKRARNWTSDKTYNARTRAGTVADTGRAASRGILPDTEIRPEFREQRTGGGGRKEGKGGRKRIDPVTGQRIVKSKKADAAWERAREQSGGGKKGRGKKKKRR